jgi:AraC family transcriptional regulator
VADGRADLEWSADGTTYKRQRVFAGEVSVVPAGQPWWTRKETAKSCIHLSLATTWLEEITHPPVILVPQMRRRDMLLVHTLKSLLETTQRVPQNPVTELYQESLVTTLVLHLATHYSQPINHQTTGMVRGVKPLSSLQLHKVSSYIAEHLSQSISLADLAQVIGFSSSQFSLRFRDTTGQTPHQFVTAVRVEQAKELLVTSQHTPADVALLTGFADQSHLTRHLRRSLGVTPGDLRK